MNYIVMLLPTEQNSGKPEATAHREENGTKLVKKFRKVVNYLSSNLIILP